MKAARLAHEVALASHGVDVHAFAKPTHSDELVRTAKRLQRLQTRKAQLRRALKSTTADINRAKRELKALCQFISRGEDTL